MTDGRWRRLGAGELGRLGGDSAHVALWQGAISVADLVQLSLITHALGLAEYGRLALAIGFVILVGQFFDVRVGAAATTFGAERLQRSTTAAVGVFQLSYLIDLTTGVLGFLVVAGLAPFVGPALIGDGGTTLIVLYALTLLASTVDESSITVLRLLDRFGLIARYTVALEVGRVGLVAGALALSGNLTAVVLALLVYECAAGAANLLAARAAFRRASGGGRLFRPAPAAVRVERRAMLRMVLHTNVVSYARLAQTQLPTILVGVIAGAAQVGLYKVGMAGGAIVGRLADPPYAALLPRISKLWAANRRVEVRRVVVRASLISVPAMLLALTMLVILRSPILELLGGGGDATAATTVLVLAGAGQAVNGAVFWNVGLLYTVGRSRLVSHIAVAGTIVQVVLTPLFILKLEADGAALAFLISVLATNAACTWFAVAALRDLRAGGDR